jgi:hypothetical protein
VRRPAFTRDVVITGGCGYVGFRQIDDVTRLVKREVVVAAALRHMAGII